MSRNKDPEAIAVGTEWGDILDMFTGKAWKLFDGDGDTLRQNDLTGGDERVNPILRFKTKEKCIAVGMKIARRWDIENQQTELRSAREEQENAREERASEQRTSDARNYGQRTARAI